jgi:hypothetical protein
LSDIVAPARDPEFDATDVPNLATDQTKIGQIPPADEVGRAAATEIGGQLPGTLSAKLEFRT